ncbi:peptidyl-prolyl cis-trans isomerase sig-7 [Nasonia vitripennis]|uniref:Peptidyl-prolyl cis-trans isomerase n=1 Tax=Nasonia vitripennis TaxID=7425 RepID=A0A7M7LMM4_NASVI|nr:peptidyl-prolyl cis-trans isomerase sig-7 [Nasonia vitripennis]
MAVVIETTVGDITVDLYTNERPLACRNFLKLCKIKYYNWNLFFTVQSNFIAQTGDPTGTGKGGESIYGIVLGEKARYFEAEQMPKIKHHKAGLLSMVNCGNNMLGSQFFITLASDLQSLDGEHCVFGEIAEGLDVILKFNEAICDGDARPYQDIRISHTVILEDPYEDPKGLEVPDRSPEPTKEALMSDRIGADEAIDDTAGMTAEEIAEMQKEKEAKARATILEIVGDIPDAEMAPPENVLFVCKLNPVTSDDDLEVIFSRFGKIVGCEVIRDRQTGDSLQYAFIEFAERKSCEEAYFKMDNVLIDDRRIHVDFSQSVAKMRWRGKGKGIKYFDEENKEEKKANNAGNNRPRDDKRNRERRRSPFASPKRERNRRKSRSRSRERVKEKKEKSSERSRERVKERREKSRERSRSRERVKSRRERSRSKERVKEKRERSRERSRERKAKSKSRDRDKRERKERKEDHRDSRTKEDRRKKKHHDKRDSSEERSERKRRKHKHR